MLNVELQLNKLQLREQLKRPILLTRTVILGAKVPHRLQASLPLWVTEETN